MWGLATLIKLARDPWAGTRGGRQSMARGIQVGDKAPDFTLPAQSGAPVRLQYRLGERVVVLYFYPKDDTRGCTAEACAFRDSYEAFQSAGAVVLGVSADTVESHQQFAARNHRIDEGYRRKQPCQFALDFDTNACISACRLDIVGFNPS